jgi:hypothetical protein
MKTRIQSLFIALVLFAGIHHVAAQGTTAFTYQGQLHDNGTNANGTYMMTFKLYDASSGGNSIGTNTISPTLANGLFTVNLDFGNVFNGSARYLDITVSNGVAQTLSPRVQVLPAPYAQFAAVAATVTNGGIMNAQLAGNAVNSTNIQNGAITTVQLAVGAVTNQNLTVNAVATTNIQNGAITDSKIAAMTSLLSTYGSETNLRVVRGIMGPLTPTSVVEAGSGTFTNFGSGYTATYYPPGSGGNLVGYYYITNDGNGDDVFTLVNGSVDNGGITTGEWIEGVSGPSGNHAEILQVQSVDNSGGPDYSFTTYGTGGGTIGNNPYVQILVNPRLASEWDITFTPHFSGVPAIAVASVSGPDAFSSGSSPLVSANGVKSGGGTNFTAIVGYNFPDSGGYPGGSWPYGDGFEFIAIGPK